MDSSKSNRSAVLYGLTYRPGGAENLEETRQGIPVYGGSAAGFQQWKFKVNARLAAIDASGKKAPEKEAMVSEFASKMIEGLQGQALQLAMDMGGDVVISRAGIAKLMDEISRNVRDTKDEELAELIRFGSRDGPMSRQSGE